MKVIKCTNPEVVAELQKNLRVLHQLNKKELTPKKEKMITWCVSSWTTKK